MLAAQGIRGPPFIPFVGALPILGWYVFRGKQLDWGMDMVKQYGPVSRHERGPISVLQLQDVDYVMAAWKTQGHHYKRASAIHHTSLTSCSSLTLEWDVNQAHTTSAPHHVVRSDACFFVVCCAAVSQCHDQSDHTPPVGQRFFTRYRG